MTKVYIYKIYFPTSGKCYIGQTANLQRRMKEHLESGSLVCRALKKYDEWIPSILHTCQSRDVANTLEIEEIRNFNSIAPNGYNLTHGGEGGTPNDEVKEKLRQASLGHKVSSETREKIGNANKGYKHLA